MRSRGFWVAVATALLLVSAICLGCSVSDEDEGTQFSQMEESEMGSEVDSYSSYETQTAEYARRYASEFETHRVDGKDVFAHVPDGATGGGGSKVPLVLFTCGTGGDPRGDAAWSGWVEESDAQGFVLVTPDYENYATYGQTGFLNDVLDWAEDEFPIDATRVYSVGFSNGGAISVAMTNDHPKRIAAISAAGWMVPLRETEGAVMPFQVIQGTGEFTEHFGDGTVRVMDDERGAIRSLMLRDGLIDSSEKADYAKTPYWGYAPDSTSSEQAGGFTWEYSNYAKDGYENAFAQLVTASDDVHRPRPDEARIAWEFLRHFSRVDGTIAES